MNEVKKRAPAETEAIYEQMVLTAAQFMGAVQKSRDYSPVLMVRVNNRAGEHVCEYPVRTMSPLRDNGHFAGVIYLLVNEEDQIVAKTMTGEKEVAASEAWSGQCREERGKCFGGFLQCILDLFRRA